MDVKKYLQELGVKECFQKNALKWIAGSFLLGVVVSGAGMAINTVSGSPLFCGACHAMKEPAASFKESTHREQNCTECHLPHDNAVVYWFAKGKTGMADTYHEVMRDYPAVIRLSPEAKQTVNANCLRCHRTTMERVHASIEGVDANCLKCHRTVAHGSYHAGGGIKVE